MESILLTVMQYAENPSWSIRVVKIETRLQDVSSLINICRTNCIQDLHLHSIWALPMVLWAIIRSADVATTTKDSEHYNNKQTYVKTKLNKGCPIRFASYNQLQ